MDASDQITETLKSLGDATLSSFEKLSAYSRERISNYSILKFCEHQYLAEEDIVSFLIFLKYIYYLEGKELHIILAVKFIRKAMGYSLAESKNLYDEKIRTIVFTPLQKILLETEYEELMK